MPVERRPTPPFRQREDFLGAAYLELVKAKFPKFQQLIGLRLKILSITGLQPGAGKNFATETV